MTARLSTPAALPSPSLALAHERIAELRAVAERTHRARLARSPKVSWPASLVAALRDSLTGSGPVRPIRRTGEPCPTC